MSVETAVNVADDTGTDELAAYYADLESVGLRPLWPITSEVVKPPQAKAVPALWRYADVRPRLLRAGELVSVEDAERRVLMMLNPNPEVAKTVGTTSTLYAAFQLVLPGETARAHRHTASAFRFVVEAAADGGAFTTVDGERVAMQPGDLVLTGNWQWHDHVNDSDEPVIWLDGLDLPLVSFFEAGFFEPHPDGKQAVTKAIDASARLFTHGRLTPTWAPPSGLLSPVLRYPWTETEKTLRNALEDTAGTETDGVVFEYTNPSTGGSVLPTLSCFVQGLRPGFRGKAHRHTTSAVYHVVRGEGTTVIDGEEYDWSEHDTFCVPTWAVHQHVNRSATDEAVLFSYTNQAVHDALGLYREDLVP